MMWLLAIGAFFVGGWMGYQNGLNTMREKVDEILESRGIDPDRFWP